MMHNLLWNIYKTKWNLNVVLVHSGVGHDKTDALSSMPVQPSAGKIWSKYFTKPLKKRHVLAFNDRLCSEKYCDKPIYM